MGFIKNLLSGREITRLEELIEKAPAPSLFVRLAELYKETGEEKKAREISIRGAEMFPDDMKLSQAKADVDRLKRDAEKRRLMAKIEQYPSPILFARLAANQVEDKEFDAAEETCDKGLKSFPDYGGLWSAMAQISFSRGDEAGGISHLEKAISLDQYNYDALIMLGDAFVRANNLNKAKEAFEKILFFAPGDIKATERLNSLSETKAQPAAAEEPVEEITVTPVEVPPPAESKSTSSSSESKRMRSSGKRVDMKTSSGIGTGLGSEIKEIRRVDGVIGTILIDPYGLVIASDLATEMNEELAAALLTNICRTAEDGSTQLTTGGFEDGIIDADECSIHLLSVAGLTLGVFTGTDTKIGLLQRAIHTFAERVIDAHE